MALGHLTAALVSRRHPRVLLVDDQSLTVSSLRRLLSVVRPRWVFSDAGGLSALREMRNWPPDVVVTELVLGEMHGVELLRTIAEFFPATVRVVYSEHLDEVHDEAHIDLAHLVLRKPATTEQIVDTLELSLELSQELQLHDAGMSLACH